MKIKRFNEEVSFPPNIQNSNEKTLEEILRDYEVYNPKEFIKYLEENGYKIVKNNLKKSNIFKNKKDDDNYGGIMSGHFSRD